MGQEIVTVIVGGAIYTAWKSVSVKYSANSPERSFQLVAADEYFGSFLFSPGVPIQLLANGSLLLSGYINDLEISIDDKSHDMRVSGRCKGQDCVDCSVKHGTHEYKNKSIVSIANDTGSNTQFTTDEGSKNIPIARANIGETPQQFIGRLARKQGMFLTALPDGTVNITKHGKKRHAGAITEGYNMLAATAKFSDRNRHQKYAVKAQKGTGTGKDNLHKEGEATDGGGRAGRYRAFMPDSTMSKSDAQTQADHIRDTRQGLSVKCEATMQGFRDDGGLVWESGWLVFVISPSLRLSQDMAIESVELTLDEGGSTSKLSLVDPKALGGKSAGGGKSKSGSAWT